MDGTIFLRWCTDNISSHPASVAGIPNISSVEIKEPFLGNI
jgi:hypothetical protein